MSSVVDRFIRYVKVDTQSDHNSTSHPSSAKQIQLANILRDELKALGLADAVVDENGNVMATLAANCARPAKTIGLLAHMDTSPDMSGANVNPRLVENYDGGDIVLNPAQNIVLSPREFPSLKKYIGMTLITTDGTTLLGADNKAGVAEIMAAVEFLAQHPEIEHGRVRIGFTTDEEVGTGIDLFDLAKFNANFAYTVDGGELGELQYENFNAAFAKVSFKGRSVHPGAAKNKMINASLVAMEFNELLPSQERPAYTTDYEGFYHLTHMQGNVEDARLVYIIRDHSHTIFEERKALMRKAAEWLNERYGSGTVKLELGDQYMNMREKIEPAMYVVDLAKRAMEEVGVAPIISPIRGGTDGARLSWKGLPTPNLFTGGQNFHGRYEFIPTYAMEKAVETLVRLVELSAN
jgi:tripeptide aminopeptidase